MRARRARERGGAVVGLVVALPGSRGGRGWRRRALVRVATTGNGSERVKTLPITRRAGARPRVVISMGPHRLPSLEGGDRLR